MEYYRKVHVVACGLILLLAVGMVWAGLSGPERDQARAIEGAVWAVASALMIIIGIRKKQAVITGNPWAPLILGLALLSVPLLAIGFVESWGLARIFKVLIYLVLGLVFLLASMMLRHSAGSAQTEE